MKRILATLLAVVMLLALSATAFATDEYYGLTVDGEPAEESELFQQLDLLGQIEVEKSKKQVTMTFPAGFFTEEETESEESDGFAQFFDTIDWQEDGSVVCTMTTEAHQEMLDGMAEQLQIALDETAQDEENYPNFVSITAKADFTVFDVVCSSENLTFNEMFSIITIYMIGGVYNVFTGEDIDNYQINFINEATGEVFNVTNSADMG